MPIELNKIRIKTFKNTLQRISDAIDSAPNDSSVRDIAKIAQCSVGTAYRYINFSAILKQKLLRKKFEHYKQLLKQQKYLIHRYITDIENSERMREFIREHK
jgi:response regulator of citrate/malate metabolism